MKKLLIILSLLGFQALGHEGKFKMICKKQKVNSVSNEFILDCETLGSKPNLKKRTKAKKTKKNKKKKIYLYGDEGIGNEAWRRHNTAKILLREVIIGLATVLDVNICRFPEAKERCEREPTKENCLKVLEKADCQIEVLKGFIGGEGSHGLVFHQGGIKGGLKMTEDLGGVGEKTHKEFMALDIAIKDILKSIKKTKERIKKQIKVKGEGNVASKNQKRA